MGTGPRADVKVDSPGLCPIARMSGAAGTPCSTISKSAASDASGRVTEEFVLDTGDDGSLDAEESVGDVEVDEVFSYGSERVYRFSRQRGRECPCECIGRFDWPLVDIHNARRGALPLISRARHGHVAGHPAHLRDSEVGEGRR